jgi:hypothetical protein
MPKLCGVSPYGTSFDVTLNLTRRADGLPSGRLAALAVSGGIAGRRCDFGHRFKSSPAAGDELWHGSQTGFEGVAILSIMSAKYYTQFRLDDTSYQGGNEFSGVIELNRPIDQDWEIADIEAVLARNFDLQQEAVTLLSWSRLH